MIAQMTKAPLDDVLFDVDLGVRHRRAVDRPHRGSARPGRVRHGHDDVPRPRWYSDTRCGRGRDNPSQLYRSPKKGPSLVDRIKHDAPVLVIGLGRFGAACAGELDRLDREVLAIDESPELVQKWSERVTHTVQADARNIDALKQVGAQDFQVAVVAVGSSIEASVLITANLVDLKIPQIWAKAVSQSHGKILARVGANHVIYPEREAGERVAHLVSGRMLDFIQFDDDFAS